MKNFSERLTNKEFIYRSFLPTGNCDFEKFNMEDIIFKSSRTLNEHNDDGNEISIKNTSQEFKETTEEKDLTSDKETDNIKYLKNIAFIYSEFLTKIIFFMPQELMEKVDSGEVNFFDAVNETINHIKVNRIYYE